ncbi:hypothetical protein [Streptomyces sp. NPDC000405]|uniref:hypothetical protein n=1 Tax=Streptomyces sp. NPDC000405 TaxID=3161033 RepID=UPI00398D4308
MTRHTASTVTDDALDALYARLDAYERHDAPHSTAAGRYVGTIEEERPACRICPRLLWADELHRYACRPCEQRLTEHLAQLPGLVRDLRGLLLPGAHTSGPTYRSRSGRVPAAPLRLDVLDVITAVTATLDSWLRDWHETLSWDAPTYGKDPLAEAAAALRANILWAVEQHPAVADFATEVAELYRTVTSLIDPAKRARRIGNCPTPIEEEERRTCGAVLRYTPGATTITCPWCRGAWDAIDLAALMARSERESIREGDSGHSQARHTVYTHI